MVLTLFPPKRNVYNFLFLCITFFYVWMYVVKECTPVTAHTWKQEDNVGKQFSPSIMSVHGIKLSSASLRCRSILLAQCLIFLKIKIQVAGHGDQPAWKSLPHGAAWPTRLPSGSRSSVCSWPTSAPTPSTSCWSERRSQGCRTRSRNTSSATKMKTWSMTVIKDVFSDGLVFAALQRPEILSQNNDSWQRVFARWAVWAK